MWQVNTLRSFWGHFVRARMTRRLESKHFNVRLSNKTVDQQTNFTIAKSRGLPEGPPACSDVQASNSTTWLSKSTRSWHGTNGESVTSSTQQQSRAQPRPKYFQPLTQLGTAVFPRSKKGAALAILGHQSTWDGNKPYQRKSDSDPCNQIPKKAVKPNMAVEPQPGHWRVDDGWTLSLDASACHVHRRSATNCPVLLELKRILDATRLWRYGANLMRCSEQKTGRHELVFGTTRQLSALVTTYSVRPKILRRAIFSSQQTTCHDSKPIKTYTDNKTDLSREQIRKTSSQEDLVKSYLCYCADKRGEHQDCSYTERAWRKYKATCSSVTGAQLIGLSILLFLCRSKLNFVVSWFTVIIFFQRTNLLMKVYRPKQSDQPRNIIVDTQ